MQNMTATQIEKDLALFAERYKGLTIPWAVLEQLAKITPGGLTVVASNSNRGKGYFLLNLTDWWLKNYDGAVIFWTGEKTNNLLLEEITRIENGKYIPRQLLQNSKIYDIEGKLYIYDKPAGAEDIRRYCQKIIEKRNLTAVVIDSLQELSLEDSCYVDENDRLFEAVLNLHWLSRKINVPLIVGCDLRFDSYSTKPQLEHFVNCGDVEQIANLVFGLWNAGNPETKANSIPRAPVNGWYWNTDKEAAAGATAMAATWNQTLMEVSILKNRLGGNVGKVVPLMFNRTTGKISSLPDRPGSYFPPAKNIRRAKKQREVGIN